MKTAIGIGATGLVGSELIRQLIDHPEFGRIRVFVRRTTGISSSKMEEHIVNFDSPGEWTHLVQGDVLFSAMGTTIKTAGSKEEQWKIDYTYQYNMAAAAAANGVPCYVLISSVGASERSKIFYSRMKGELDREISKLPFQKTIIIRPGILEGKRPESRPGEVTGIRVMSAVSKIGFLRRFRPVPAKTVARAMISAALDDTAGVKVYTLEEVFTLGRY